MTKKKLPRPAQIGKPVLNDLESTKIANAAKKRLGLPNSKMAVTSALAAAILGRKHPENKAQQLDVLREFVAKHATRQAAAEAIATARMAAGYERPPSKREMRERRKLLSPYFLASPAWRTLRMIVLKKRGTQCECCGAKAPDVRINVDHIKPRRTHPELALVEANLQVLCEDCNHGKGSWDTTDWRAPGTTQGELTDSPVPGTATATSILSAAPRLVRRR